MSELQVGDICVYIYAQPGNDRTYGVITELRGDHCTFYDVTFDFQIDDLALRHIWKASERELDSSIGFFNAQTGERRSATIRQLAEEAKARNFTERPKGTR